MKPFPTRAILGYSFINVFILFGNVRSFRFSTGKQKVKYSDAGKTHRLKAEMELACMVQTDTVTAISSSGLENDEGVSRKNVLTQLREYKNVCIKTVCADLVGRGGDVMAVRDSEGVREEQQ